jgi:hypothetical protein
MDANPFGAPPTIRLLTFAADAVIRIPLTAAKEIVLPISSTEPLSVPPAGGREDAGQF